MKKFLYLLVLSLGLMLPLRAGPPPGTAQVFFNAATTNTSVLAAQGIHQLVGYNATNTNTSVVYVQFFDAATAGAVTPGTTAPYFVLGIPANSGVIDGLQSFGPGFSLGCVFCVTTTATGGTAPANTVPVSLFFN
jgi:hypothetical protein